MSPLRCDRRSFLSGMALSIPSLAYPAEFVRTHGLSQNVLGWKEPLSAILTLSPDGGIRIEGSKSDFLFGATPEKAGLDPYDVNGRRITAEIQSANLKLG